MATLTDQRCVQIGLRTETGKFREQNEDRIYANPDRCLFIVADGMGGHQAGETASLTAVRAIAHFIESRLDRLADQPHGNGSRGLGFFRRFRALNAVARTGPEIKRALPDDNYARLVGEAFETANERIRSLSKTHSHLKGMGTTVVVVLLVNSVAYVCWVGDSRAYLAHDHDMIQLTRDHTLAQALIDQGMLTAEQARRHPYRNILERYVGSKEMGQPEIVTVDVQDGDQIVLASDGLTGSLSEAEMVAILQNGCDSQRAADRLVDRALRQGSRDNVSCIVVAH